MINLVKSIGDRQFMALALELAKKGIGKTHPNPMVGCVVVKNGHIVGQGYHSKAGGTRAEIQALRRAGDKAKGADMYVTLEPCPMCAQAISFARIRRLYFGATDFKGGGVENGPKIFSQSTCHHRPDVYGGIDENQSSALLRDFFRDRR